MNMILIFTENITLALTACIIAFTYKEFLLPGLLHPWAKVGDRYERRWFYKPVWGCFKCIGGQLAMWLYLITHIYTATEAANGAPGRNIINYIHSPAFGHYSFIGHILTICAAILFTDLLSTLHNKLS